MVCWHLHSPAHRLDPPCPCVRWPEGRLLWWSEVGLRGSFHCSHGDLQHFPAHQRCSSCADEGAEEARPARAPAAAPGAPERVPSVLCAVRIVLRGEADAGEVEAARAGTPARQGGSEDCGPLNFLLRPSPDILRIAPSCSNLTCDSTRLAGWVAPSCGTERHVQGTDAHRT